MLAVKRRVFFSFFFQRPRDPQGDLLQEGGGHLVHGVPQPEAPVQDPRLQPVQPRPASAGAELRIRGGEDSAAPGHIGLPQEWVVVVVVVVVVAVIDVAFVAYVPALEIVVIVQLI